MKAVLLYNPHAGQKRRERTRLAEQAAEVLRTRGFDLWMEPTREKGSAGQQSREAIRDGAAAVFACGGDGTIHDVLQGVAATGAALGIAPMGSANALARELGLPMDPLRAVAGIQPDRVVELRTTVVRRAGMPDLYSLCMAGAGPDGALMYRMLMVDRAKHGRWRYYEHALRLFLSHRFAPFVCRVRAVEGSVIEERVVAMMALRIGDLGGLFSGVARGASVLDDSLRVVLVSPPARVSLPLWLALSWCRMGWLHPGVRVVQAHSVEIDKAVPLQVDGEWAGKGPVSVSLDGPVQRVLLSQNPP